MGALIHRPSSPSGRPAARAVARAPASRRTALAPKASPSRPHHVGRGRARPPSAHALGPTRPNPCACPFGSRAAMLGITSVLIANYIPGSIPLPITFPDASPIVLPF